MRRQVLTLVVLMSLCSLGYSLECFRCDLGFWDVCYTTKTNCTEDELCYVGIGKAVSVLDIKVMGCLPIEACNKTTVVEFLANKTLYTMKTSCCLEELCNAGTLDVPCALFLFAVLLIVHIV
ncbi:hypothetical protein DNTS_008202 [Danionella cerebrum]|uniref:UPAR/Ly6 domain-containing protein n=1 Tax=Danionella cerebrum TaxID=2873325 RepID=A0A553R5M5_9TELE|nr:hypothetical protein DNTS_008202 [Danionella translucida]